VEHFREERFEKQNAADLIEQIERFDGSPEQFLQNILSVQCFLGQAEEGAILSDAQDSRVNVLAVYPELEKKGVIPEWLAQSVESVFEAISENNTIVKPLQVSEDPDGKNAEQRIILIPLEMVDMSPVVAAFFVRGDSEVIWR